MVYGGSGLCQGRAELPHVQEHFDQVMEAAMKKDYTGSEGGGRERLPKGTCGAGEEVVLVYAASQDEVAAVLALVESAANRFESHPVIQNIINEEAAETWYRASTARRAGLPGNET